MTAVNNSIGSLAVTEMSRQNTNVTLLTSAARTVQTNSPDQTNNYYRNAIVYLNISAASGTGGLTVNFQAKDTVSGNYVTVKSGSALTSIGTYVYAAGPAANWASATLNWNAASPIPYMWRIQITVGDSSSYTYSLSADLLS